MIHFRVRTSRRRTVVGSLPPHILTSTQLLQALCNSVTSGSEGELVVYRASQVVEEVAWLDP